MTNDFIAKRKEWRPVRNPQPVDNTHDYSKTRCWRCDGSGEFAMEKCSMCNGSGIINA